MASHQLLWPSVVSVVLAAALSAQDSRPRFEVVSVKPQSSQRVALSAVGDMMPRVHPGGVFSATHAQVGGLLMFALDLREYRIVGGPDWIWRDMFQIDARAGSDASADQVKLMVQALLEDRFQLAAHKERRETRFQALVRARPDAPLGPSLLKMDDCSAAVVRDLRKTNPGKYPTPTGGIVSGCHRLSDFADFLAVRLRTPVIDETGLTGAYYYSLRAELPDVRGPALLGARVGPDQDFPSLRTALEQQLGLKLESRMGPMEVLVIDSVQHPTEN